MSASCHHLHSTGKRCGSPALRGEQFCFYHHPTRRPPVRTRRAEPGFYIPPVVDSETLQMALAEILRRLADNRLSLQRARLLVSTLKMAQANLTPYFGFNQSHSSPPPVPDLSALLSAAGLQATASVRRH